MSRKNMLIYVSGKEKDIINQHVQECITNFTQINIKKLAKDLGIKEVKEEFISGSASGYIQNENDEFVIGVEASDSETRKRFTIAHELAHFLLHKKEIIDIGGGSVVDSRLYRSNLTSDLEVEANRLAADLVMPMELLRHFVKSTEQITYNQLSEKLGVSLQALKVRLGSPY